MIGSEALVNPVAWLPKGTVAGVSVAPGPAPLPVTGADATVTPPIVALRVAEVAKPAVGLKVTLMGQVRPIPRLAGHVFVCANWVASGPVRAMLPAGSGIATAPVFLSVTTMAALVTLNC